MSRMNDPSNTESPRRTPKNKFTPTQPAGRAARADTGFDLSLRNIIGTTTTSANGFSVDQDSHSFAVCAGSAVVLSQLDENLDITKRFFRTRPDAWPTNITPSFYSSLTSQGTPDSHSRPKSSLKDGGYRQAGGGNPMGVAHSEPSSRSKANKLARDASCVSLSPGGKFLAVGEVSSLGISDFITTTMSAYNLSLRI